VTSDQRSTEVAIAEFKAVHSFEALSVTSVQRSTEVAIVALFWSVSSTRRQKYKFSTVARQIPSQLHPAFRTPAVIKLTKGLDEIATATD
jgi:hypothetical protein